MVLVGYYSMKEKNMAYMTIEDVKEYYEVLSKEFENIEYDGYVNIRLNLSYRSLLRLEIGEYMMYLIAADGQLTESELRMFNTITSCNYDMDELIAYIRENNIYSTSFETTVPISMEIAVKQQLNGIPGTEYTYPELVYSLFEYVGKLMTEVDGEVTHTERRDYRIYLNMLDSYLNDMGFTCNY